MRQRYLITILLTLFTTGLHGQNISTERVLTLNFINPGIDFETPLGQKTTFAINPGIGYGVSYPKLSVTGTGALYMISPFLDLQARKYYNLEKRNESGKNAKRNSGNFYGLRFLARGKEFRSSFYRDHDLDFAIGPTWGLKRAYNRINLVFDIGPIVYWDKETTGFFPLIFEINLGYILTKN